MKVQNPFMSVVVVATCCNELGNVELSVVTNRFTVVPFFAVPSEFFRDPSKLTTFAKLPPGTE